ncbi:hypothetical protein D3C81_1670460 [compost metagenome]
MRVESLRGARLAVFAISLAYRIKEGEEHRPRWGDLLLLQCALDLAREVFGNVGGDVADQGMQARMEDGFVGHGGTLTGVGPPSKGKVADGAGWRAGANTTEREITRRIE